MRTTPFFLLIPLCVLLSSCAQYRKPHPAGHRVLSADPHAVLTLIRGCNEEITRFKGIGKATFEADSPLRHARVAWMGADPEMLRIEILNPTGQPLLRMSADEHFLYLQSIVDQTYYKTDDRSLDMKDLIAVSIHFDELFALLKGCIPLPPHDAAIELTESSGETILEVNEGWLGPTSKIYIDESGASFYKLERFDVFGNLLYRVEFSAYQVIDNHKIPHKIRLANGDGIGLTLSIDRFWVNIPVEKSAFTLVPSGKIE